MGTTRTVDPEDDDDAGSAGGVADSAVGPELLADEEDGGLVPAPGGNSS